jgi:excisionase family DNA binding protein
MAKIKSSRSTEPSPKPPPPRLALRWPDEVAAALGVSRSWLYDSGLAGELRFFRSGRVRLVLVSELERVVERLSARWDE